MNEFPSYSTLLEQRKRTVHVLILGDYSVIRGYRGKNKKICVERLENLKFSLIAKGFAQTRLVKDWVDEKNSSRGLE